MKKGVFLCLNAMRTRLKTTPIIDTAHVQLVLNTVVKHFTQSASLAIRPNSAMINPWCKHSMR